MEFNPNNHVVQLCMQGLAGEGGGETEEAGKMFHKAWDDATNDFEKFLAAHFLARHQSDVHDKLKWFETALHLALQVNNDLVNSAFYGLYGSIAKCYEDMGDPDNAKKNHELASSSINKVTDKGPFYHGTRAHLPVGNLLTPGVISNYDAAITMNHIYFTASANVAGLAAALAKGDGRERVYIIEPTGSFENDPNVTDKKMPGNPTRSYRSAAPLKIIGEATDWARQAPEDIQRWREKLANNKGEIIN